MKTMLLIGLGGGVGSMLRYATTLLFAGRAQAGQFPYGTFAVNVIGCFVIGVVYALAERFGWFTPQLRLLLATGLCGGYTTFSAFAYENIHLIQQSNYMMAAAYILLSVVVCLLSVGLGLWLVKSVFGSFSV